MQRFNEEMKETNRRIKYQSIDPCAQHDSKHLFITNGMEIFRFSTSLNNNDNKKNILDVY